MGSFTADAIIAKLVFADTFTRTVADGWGAPYMQRPTVSSSLAVDGSVGTVGLSQYSDLSGMPRLRSGIIQFDYLIPANLSDSGGGVFSEHSNPSAGVEAYGVECYRDSATQWAADIYPSDTFYPFDVDPSTWYTFKFHVGRNTGDPVGIKVWPAADPEPEAWGQDGIRTGPFSNWFPSALYVEGHNTEVGQFDNYYLWSTDPVFEVSGYFSANAVLYSPTVFGSFAANAVIESTRSGSFTADADISLYARINSSFTANAVRRKTIVKDVTPADPLVIGSSKASSWPAVSGISVAKPTGTESGDLVLATVIVQGGIGNPTTTMSGGTTWTKRATIETANNEEVGVFWKIAGGSEPSTYAAGTTINRAINVTVLTVRGVTAILEYYGQTSTFPVNGDMETVTNIRSGWPSLGVGIFLTNQYGPTAPAIDAPLTIAQISPDYFVQQSIGYEYLTGPGTHYGPYTATAGNGNEGTHFALSLLLGLTSSSTANAILAQSAIVGPNHASFSANAWFAERVRHQHTLGDDPHLDFEFADDVHLADDIGIFPAITSSLHEFLSYLDQAITIRESFITGFLSLDAIIKANLTASAIVDAILRVAQESSFTGDAHLSVAPTLGDFTADAVTLTVIEGGLSADATVFATIEDDLVADALIEAEVVDSAVADAVLLTTAEGSFLADATVDDGSYGFTADAIALRTTEVSFTEDANIVLTTTDSMTADAVVLRTISGSFTADAVVDGEVFLVEPSARITQALTEAMVAYAAPDPTDITGAGVTQALIEAMVASDEAAARISGELVEMMVSDDDAAARITQNIVETMTAYTAPTPTDVTGAGVTQALVEVMSTADEAAARITSDLIEIMVGTATGSEDFQNDAFQSDTFE